jgi:hypothetical protein
MIEAAEEQRGRYQEDAWQDMRPVSCGPLLFCREVK